MDNRASTNTHPSVLETRREPSRARYGSDLIVDLLQAFGIEYVAANPGATFRGLHESLVNYAGDVRPHLVEVCHEEIGVAMAHGYAKASGRPMAVALHNVVGLVHASMAIFNAWCDRVPVLLLGGTGPMDATRRRPWIDWVHTALPQVEPVRPFLKWDDQPASHAAMIESFIQAHHQAVSDPPGPVYLCYDVLLQEDELSAPPDVPDPGAYPTPTPPAADVGALRGVADLLLGARGPVIVVEALGRLPGAGGLLEELATLLAAPVLEVTRGGSSVRNSFELDLTGCEDKVLSAADVILALGVRDLEEVITRTDDTTRTVTSRCSPDVRIVDVGLRALGARSWLPEGGRLLPLAASITSRPDLALGLLVEVARARRDESWQRDGQADGQARVERAARWTDLRQRTRQQWQNQAQRSTGEEPIALAALALALGEALGAHPWVLANQTARGWTRRLWNWEDPHAFLGTGGGAGQGYGIGASVGAALAHRDTGRVVVNLQGDGDLLYTPSALWTAAHERLPLLTVMLNNRSYYQDEYHQRLLSVTRGRPAERAGIGTQITDPAVDFAGLARSMGVFAIGPVTAADALPDALDRALRVVVEERRPALVDVIVQPR
jgi:acetolactate synthase-1/2/3 large subunit